MATQFILTGTFTAGDNAPGKALIQVSWRYPYRATGVILGTDVREKELDSTGSFSITVPLPAGLQADPVLRVDYLPKTGTPDVRYFQIARSTSGTVNLASLTAVDQPEGWLLRLSDLIAAGGGSGAAGVGVASLAVSNGHLMATLTDGQTVDAGLLPTSTVPGPKGDKGDTGAVSTVAGPKGDTGTQGVKGDKGDPGTPGTGGGAVTRHGLALVDPDGGHRYYDRFRYGLPSHPDYFPFGLWGTWVDAAWQVPADQAAGINLYIGLTTGSDLGLLAGTGSKALLQSDWWASYASWKDVGAVAGWMLHDEVDMRYNGSGGDQSQGLADLAADLAAIKRDGRMTYANFGKGVAFYGSDYSSRRYVNEYADATSLDIYWFTDSDAKQQYQGGKLVNGSVSALTDDQAHQPYNYGLVVQRVRSLVTPERRAPVWNFVELGQPFDSTKTAITTAEIASAVWHSIIAGARGIAFFNNTFGATPDYNILRNQTAIRDAVTALTARVRSIARQINAPSVPTFATATSGVALTSRYEGGAYWIIAGSRQSASQTATFTLNTAVGSDYTVAEVVGEGRTVPITSRAFSDTFSTKDAVHIYKIVR